MLDRHIIVRRLVLCGFVVAVATGAMCSQARAENEGLADLDEAMRRKITAEGLEDLNQVIALLQSALDKDLELEDAEFAEIMLSDSLLERASALIRVVNTQSILNAKVQQVRRLVVSDLRRVLAYDDPPPQAHLMLGRMMALPGGDPHEARRALTSYLETEGLSNEQRAEALVLRARVQTDEAKVIADVDEAIRLVPDDASYRLVRAVFFRSQNKLKQALSEVEQVLARTPDDANALILQGEVFRKLGMLDEALKSFDQAAKFAPRSPGPPQNRGEIFREQGNFEKAIAEFSKVLELQPGALHTLLHRAEAYLYSGHLAEALADVDIVLKKHPDITAHRIRAEVLAKMDRLEEAIEEMQRVAEAMPDRPELKLQLALYYLVNHQPRKAIATYTEVLAEDANNFIALRSRGDTYLNIGRHVEAVADLEKALSLQPDDPAVLNNLAWVLATSPDAPARNGKRAIELAKKACEKTDYSQSHILSTLAAAFAETGEFDEAIKWSQQAVDMKDPEHQEQLAAELANYKKGKPWREKQSVRDRDVEAEKSPTEIEKDVSAKETEEPKDDSVEF